MYKIEDIEESLIQSDRTDLPKNFVAIAAQLDGKGEAYHSGLIISHNGSIKLFHYDAADMYVSDVPKTKWYFHKNSDLFQTTAGECSAFLTHCKIILKEASPEYGYFFDSSYYKDGKYFSKSGIGEYMTCVGFCINAIAGYIEAKDYFTHTDWTEDNQSLKHFDYFIKKHKLRDPKIDPEQYKKHLRRIKPSEFTASAFLSDLPIRKAETDKLVTLVEQVFSNKIEKKVA